MRHLLLIVTALMAAACSTPSAAGETSPDVTPEPSAVCAEKELSERLECADDAYSDYVTCSMSTGGTGDACENSAGPAGCMSSYLGDLAACDSAWPECAAPVAADVLPGGFECLLELYECRVVLEVCDQAGLDTCTDQHYGCAVG